MNKEHVFCCKTCGKIETVKVKWITLQQSVIMSVCPVCEAQICKDIPVPKPVRLKDTFDKYRGIFNDRK